MSEAEVLRRCLWRAWQVGCVDGRLIHLPWYVDLPQKTEAHLRQLEYQGRLRKEKESDSTD